MSTDHTIFEDRDVASEPSPGLDSDLPGDDTLRGTDYYAQGDTDGSPVFNVTGGDWDDLVDEATALHEERIVVNMGPQHPSTHGVLRLILELDAETVTEARAGIGYLHTGIEKNMEFRTWVQGVTFCTRMDYLTPMFQEAAYCLAVEKLLGITDQIPERASIIRVLMMELTRINSHLVCIGTGGVSQDLPHGALDHITTIVGELRRGIHELEMLLAENPLLKGRTKGVGYLDLTGCIALSITGPVLRSTGLPHDLRKSEPYCGYETYDFDVITRTGADAYDRLMIRILEMFESLKIVEQCVERLRTTGGPVMVEDKKIAWPAQLSVGSDGQGNSLDHIREIMGTSMESLIHHFKLVTEGFRVPPGQVYVAVESAKGELGVHLVSDGGTRPYRAHFRDPSFNNLQAVAAMCEGSMVADVIVAVASIDPVMGGVDR